eukprot:3680661-Prorocentrum_lima.AAC.1
MTSSLVGSEMCIRDRATARATDAGGSATRLGPAPCTSCSPPHRRRRRSCLLYTSDAADDM